MEDQLSVNRRQFQILLQQLNVTEDTMIRHLEGGQIIKLTVHKNKKTWHFHFKLKNVLPYQIFERFHTQLTRTFSHIAQVTCSIEAENPSIDEQLVQDYWTRCIQELDGISPPILTLLNDQKPKLTGNKILLKTKTDTEASALKKKYSSLIQSSYCTFGFPELQLDTEIFVSDQEIQKFREQKMAEDQELSLIHI